MARIRNIKPEFFTHEELQDMELEHPELHPMLVFSCLWTQCEWSGVFSWSIRKLKIAVLPFLNYDLEKSLEYLKNHGFIGKFSRDGKDYGFVYNFSRYQAISGKERNGLLKYPVPTKDDFPDKKTGENHFGTNPELDGNKTGTNPELDGNKTGSPDFDFDSDIGHRTYDNDNDNDFPGEKNSLSSPDSEPFPQKESMPRQTSPPGLIPGDPAAVWETIRNAWNGHNCRFTCDKIFFNLSHDQRERVRGSMATYTPDQMVGAIGKYFEERKAKPDGYEYKSFYLFVEKGMEFYAEA